MSKIISKYFFKSKNIGIIVASVGVGITLAILVPIWMWIIVAGLGLIYSGWCLINEHR